MAASSPPRPVSVPSTCESPLLRWRPLRKPCSFADKIRPKYSLFYFISLVIHGIVTSRHRRVGLPSKPVPVGSSAGQPYQMTGQTKPTYAAVPQQGMPFTQQETAYNPHGLYGIPAPPQQQQHTSYYAPGTTQQEYHRNTPPQLSTSPAPTHPTVSDSYHRTPSPQAPPAAAYGAPYQPYQPPQ